MLIAPEVSHQMEICKNGSVQVSGVGVSLCKQSLEGI